MRVFVTSEDRAFSLVLEGGNLPVILGPCDEFHIIDKERSLYGVTAPGLRRATRCWSSTSTASTTVPPTALCPSRLFLARYPLAPSLQGRHQRFAARAFLARLHQIPRRGGRRVRLLPALVTGETKEEEMDGTAA